MIVAAALRRAGTRLNVAKQRQLIAGRLSLVGKRTESGLIKYHLLASVLLLFLSCFASSERRTSAVKGREAQTITGIILAPSADF